MKQLTVTINGKGGVGKTLVTSHFLSYLEDRSIPFAAVDTDLENSTLTRYFPQAHFVNLSDKRRMDTIFTLLDSNDLVVVDARAASTDIFLTYFRELQVFDLLKQLNTRLTLMSPINHEADSIEQVRVLAEAIGKNASYVVVKNQSHSQQFKIWDNSKTREKLGELDGQEIIMPRIYDWLASSLDQANLTVSQALKNGTFNSLDSQRLLNWKNLFYAELDSVRELLVPEQNVSASAALAARRAEGQGGSREGKRRGPRVANVKDL